MKWPILLVSVRAIRATTALVLGKPDLSLADIDKARQLRGQPDILIFANRGLALDRLGRYSEALEEYENAYITKPNEVNTWWLRYGMALYENGQVSTRALFQCGGLSADPLDGLLLLCL